MGANLFSQETSDRTRGKVLKLHRGQLRLDIRKNFFTEMVIIHWIRQPKAVMGSLFLERFNKHVDVALRDMV